MPCAQHPGEQLAKGLHTAHLLNDGTMSTRRPPYCLRLPGGPLAPRPTLAWPPTLPSCETLPARALLSGCPRASVSDPCEPYHAVLRSHAWGSLVPHPSPAARRSCLSTRLSAFTSEPPGRAGPHPAFSEPAASPGSTQGTALI